MIYGYIRVSSDKQTTENQRFEIENFSKLKELLIDEWIEETISVTKKLSDRKFGKLLDIMQKSDYFNSHKTVSTFGENATTSFVILSDIEKRIKEKIEKVGTPLKDWGINIYRGILTGYNEAFIIDGKTKDKLIEKSPKNAEIIRPIFGRKTISYTSYPK